MPATADRGEQPSGPFTPNRHLENLSEEVTAPVPVLSVVVCTRDRADRLARLMDSLCRLDVPPELEWELLVVDNGSRDETPRVANSYGERLPLRVVVETTPGLSRARNRALDTARGDALLWTDDDTTVPSGWLAGYAEAFERYPAAAFFGGPVAARIEGVAPGRLHIFQDVVGGALCHHQPPIGLTCLNRNDWHLPWGANMAFRRSSLAGRRFDTQLGRAPGKAVLSGEEAAVQRAIIDAGGHGIWLPDVGLVHHVDRSRMRHAYLRRYFHGVGWGEGYNLAKRSRHTHRLKIEREARRLVATRQAHGLVPPWAPLARRLRALRDISYQRGVLAGLKESTSATGGPSAHPADV